jgi:hypothetical protein
MKKTQDSKIAVLPRDVRERINRMMLEGKSPEAILAGVRTSSSADSPGPSDPSDRSELAGAAGSAHVQLADLTDEDIIAWQKKGHQDWLEERKQLAELEHIRDLARAVLASGDGAVIQEASLQIVAARLYELLNWFNPKTFKKKAHQNLADYARLVNALIKLSDSGLKYERYRAQVAEHKAEMEKALAAENQTPGLSPEAREIIERELKLM